MVYIKLVFDKTFVASEPPANKHGSKLGLENQLAHFLPWKQMDISSWLSGGTSTCHIPCSMEKWSLHETLSPSHCIPQLQLQHLVVHSDLPWFSRKQSAGACEHGLHCGLFHARLKRLHGQSLILIAKHIEFSCWLARLASIPFCRKALKNLSSHPNLTSIIFHYLQATYLVSWLLTYKSSWITYAKFRIDVYRVLIESRINGHHRWICFMDVWWFVYIFPLQAQQIKLLYIQSIMTHPRPNQRGWF